MDPTKKIADTAAAASRLKNFIVSDVIAEGDPLPTEQELAASLNIDRSAVREAVVVLQALGYIETSHGNTFVVKLDNSLSENATHWFSEHVEQMGDYMEARQAIESAAAGLAAQRATLQEIEYLDQIHGAFESAHHEDDVAGLAQADKTFHDAVFRATHNRVLSIINHKLEKAFEKYRIKSFSIKESRPRTLNHHRSILDAIRNRDAKKAEREMRNHLDIGSRDVS